MRSSYFSVVLLFVPFWILVQNVHAQVELISDEGQIFLYDQVTSSSFEMVFYPTLQFDTSTTAKVANIIKNQLAVSSSNTNTDFSFQTIEILVEEINFDERYQLEESLPSSSYANNSVNYVPASRLEFKVVLGLHNDGQTSTLPSRFALDNLVVRTFSQPSTKSTFVDLITQTLDPSLVVVLEIVIDLVTESFIEKNGEQTNALSSIDVILIIMSSGVFVGVFFIMITHYQKHGYEDIWEEESVKGGKRCDHHVSEEINQPRVPLEKVLHVQGNIVEAGSLESSIDSQSQNVLSIINDSPVISYTSSYSTTSSSSTSSSSTYTSATKEYRDNTREELIERSDRSMNSESVDHDSKKSTFNNDDLASMLNRLPGPNICAKNLRSNPIQSSVASAPTILQDIIGQWKNKDLNNIRSIRSNRSTASPKYLKPGKKRKKTGHISLHPTLEKRFVSNGFLMFGSTEEFHKSWVESQRKALEDIQEGSVEDVFQIDSHSNSDVAEKREETEIASLTPVSEWMKLIRVVNSASETQSLVENSPIEPKVFQATETLSIDLSLEGSLAKSSVDAEIV